MVVIFPPHMSLMVILSQLKSSEMREWNLFHARWNGILPLFGLLELGGGISCTADVIVKTQLSEHCM